MPLPFHVAVPVRDLAAARAFYGGVLGLPEGRVDHGDPCRWVDYDMFGHQFVVHEVTGGGLVEAANPVDGDAVPVPHCGAILDRDAWRTLADRLTAAGLEFIIPPRVRFAGTPGEQHTMFLRDPSGNALEFKAFADVDAQLFAK